MDEGHEGYVVTVDRVDGAQRKMPTYPLLSEDLLVKEDDGTWTKIGPGTCVGGFVLTPEQEASLQRVRYQFGYGGAGLGYIYEPWVD